LYHHDGAGGLPHLGKAEGNENTAQPLGLQSPHESLDDGDTAVASDCAEARLDAVAGAPRAELVAELGPLVGHRVPRGAAGVAHGTFEDIG